MRCVLGFVCALALAPLGCGETSGTGGSGGAAGTGGDGGSAGAGGTVETGELLITTWETASDGDVAGPLPGVEVCEFDTANCVVSDDRGFATLQLPVEQDIMVSVESDGRGPLLGVDVVAADELTITSFFPLPESLLAEAWEPIGFSYPLEEGTGTAFLSINPQLGATTPGATFELLGDSARAYYIDVDGNYDPDLEVTSATGVGSFFELAPGEHQIRIGGTAENCTVWRGWEGDSPNTIRFPVRAGYSTALRVWCD